VRNVTENSWIDRYNILSWIDIISIQVKCYRPQDAGQDEATSHWLARNLRFFFYLLLLDKKFNFLIVYLFFSS
jgi:hypothetical protein